MVGSFPTIAPANIGRTKGRSAARLAERLIYQHEARRNCSAQVIATAACVHSIRTLNEIRLLEQRVCRGVV